MIILINKDDSINYIKLPIIHGSKYLSVPKPTKVVEAGLNWSTPLYKVHEYELKLITDKTYTYEEI